MNQSDRMNGSNGSNTVQTMNTLDRMNRSDRLKTRTHKNLQSERFAGGNGVFAKAGRIHARSQLHLKSAIGYERSLVGRIELELLQAALRG
jgi:hypothetical protein